MKCHDARAILSAYYDGELPTDRRIAIEVHLEGCVRCAAELAEFRRLSQTASNLADPKPPEYLWNHILERLNSREDVPLTRKGGRWLWSPAARIAAAVIVLAASFGIYFSGHDHTTSDALAEYWQQFETAPGKAQEKLVAQYSGQVVSDDEAMRKVGYRPLTSAHVPEGVAVEKNYVLDMPCCKCIQTVCRRDDGTVLAVFEHDEHQPGWFQGRPHVQMQSGGAACRVTELNVYLAASWRVGRRTVTIVGLRNVGELSQWVHALDPTSTERDGKPTRVGRRGILSNRRIELHPQILTDAQRLIGHAVSHQWSTWTEAGCAPLT